MADNRVDSRNKVLSKHQHNGSVSSIATGGQNHQNSIAPVAGGNPRN